MRWKVRAGGLVVALAALAGGSILLLSRLDFSDPDQVWAQAEAALRGGRLKAAQAALKKLEKLRRPTALDWLLRAQVATGSGHDDEALEALRNVPEQHPMAAQAHLLAGRIERKLHRLRRAEASLRKAVEREPGLIEAHKELIFIYGIQLRKREIDTEFKALASLTQLTHHDLFTWGLTHFTDWDSSSATDLETALETDPGDRHTRLALANLLFDQPEMEGRVQKVLEPLPSDDPEAAALRIELLPSARAHRRGDRVARKGPSREPAPGSSARPDCSLAERPCGCDRSLPRGAFRPTVRPRRDLRARQGARARR